MQIYKIKITLQKFFANITYGVGVDRVGLVLTTGL